MNYPKVGEALSGEIHLRKLGPPRSLYYQALPWCDAEGSYVEVADDAILTCEACKRQQTLLIDAQIVQMTKD